MSIAMTDQVTFFVETCVLLIFENVSAIVYNNIWVGRHAWLS